MKSRLTREFFLNPDVVDIARKLLGKVLITEFNGEITGGIITETEAYAGVNDRASHAYGGRKTRRTEVMYAVGGTVYVYLCYGMHHLFNVVTNKKDIPHAVLIRSVYPLMGVDLMMKRRGKLHPRNLCPGPATVSQALGITVSDTNSDLIHGNIRIDDFGFSIPIPEIKVSTRIGVDYAGEDAKLPYRFYLSEKFASSLAL